MRKHPLFLLSSLLIAGACQAPTIPLSTRGAFPPPNTSVLRQQSTNGLPLSPAFRQELSETPNLEAADEAPFNEQQVEQILGVEYIQSHSYYYQTPDTGLQNDSSVVAILKHDGHLQAARWTLHWQSLLGEAAVWPDAQSTTYQGRWPALEHAELKDGDGWFFFRSASEKASEYYARALENWQPGVAATHPSQAEAWRWLGRASHFLHDVTVPFHTVSLIRPAQLLHHTRYEKSCDTYFERYLPSRNYNPAGVWVKGPYPADENWGLYFTPQTPIAERVKYTADQARAFYGLVNEAESGQNWEKARAVMIPLGAKLTAGLVVKFLQDVKAF